MDFLFRLLFFSELWDILQLSPQRGVKFMRVSSSSQLERAYVPESRPRAAALQAALRAPAQSTTAATPAVVLRLSSNAKDSVNAAGQYDYSKDLKASMRMNSSSDQTQSSSESTAYSGKTRRMLDTYAVVSGSSSRRV